MTSNNRNKSREKNTFPFTDTSPQYWPSFLQKRWHRIFFSSFETSVWISYIITSTFRYHHSVLHKQPNTTSTMKFVSWFEMHSLLETLSWNDLAIPDRYCCSLRRSFGCTCRKRCSGRSHRLVHQRNERRRKLQFCVSHHSSVNTEWLFTLLICWEVGLNVLCRMG